MNSLRKIIKEEIERLFSESLFYDASQSDVFRKEKSPNDEIIYNYNLGYAFASNTLQVDIDKLNRYSLDEYFPKSINEESWSFTFETAIGIILVVDIKRIIRGNKSFWSLIFSILDRGDGELPEIQEEVENIEGYDKFISVVNSTISRKIDPSRY